MARLQRSNSRTVLLDAAEAVVEEHGAAHLTLDAVASRAGVSKGGLLYHFPTKQALLEGMVTRLLDRFDERQARASDALAGDAAGPLKAYVLAALTHGAGPEHVNTALLAAGANNPELLAPVRDHLAADLERTTATGPARARAAAVVFAVNGLWLAELLRLSPLTDAEREQTIAELLRLAAEAV